MRLKRTQGSFFLLCKLWIRLTRTCGSFFLLCLLHSCLLLCHFSCWHITFILCTYVPFFLFSSLLLLAFFCVTFPCLNGILAILCKFFLSSLLLSCFPASRCPVFIFYVLYLFTWYPCQPINLKTKTEQVSTRMIVRVHQAFISHGKSVLLIWFEYIER